MRHSRLLMGGLILALAFGVGSAQAGIDINEVGAFLVYPGVAAAAGRFGGVETFLTITNTSTQSIIAHVAFINGESGDKECFEYDFDVPMTGLDTETLVLVRQGPVTHITNLDTGATRTVSQQVGFVTVDVEDFDHNVLTDNILLGSEIIVSYTHGAAYSIPAIPIQGESGDGDRNFAFDGSEYRLFPSVVGADFLAPDFWPGLDAHLILFTLGFDSQLPPFTDCSYIGYDAFESQFSGSFQFGCWTHISLSDIDPEFAYPFLGDAFDYQEHGWLQLECTVFGTGLSGVANGGVHGAIAQMANSGTVLRRNDSGPGVNGAVGWARLLYQSGTVGDALTLTLGAPGTGGQF